MKGHAKNKKNNGVQSTKLNSKIRQQKSKLTNHRGLLKRVKIVIFY